MFATLDPALRSKGSLALVVPGDAPASRAGRDEDKMGHRASSTSTIRFEEVRVPVANRLSTEGQGFSLAMRTLDQTRTPIGALADRDSASRSRPRRALQLDPPHLR